MTWLPGSLRHPSLARRLVLLALGWSLAALVVTAIVFALLFQQAAVRRVDQTLNDLTVNLVTYSTVEEGQVFAPPFTDERALRVYSGRYWEIAEPTADGKLRPLARSHSLFDAVLNAPPDLVARLKAKPGRHISYDTRGPLNEPLRARAQQNWKPGRKAPIIFLAAEDRSSVNRDVQGFVAATAAAFIVLGAGLVVAIVMQVRVGLRPLFELRREVAAVRRGKAERLAATYPSELTPLADELNALVDHNRQVVDRQRTHVGNLAHALKTPISVMIAEAGQRPGPLAEVVTRQAEAMRQQVDHHLRRARAAARTQGQGERTSVAEVLDELTRTLQRIFHDKGVSIDWDAADDLYFLGERQDLLEIAGNAVENACKWCRSRVKVRAEAAGPARFRLVVEDDGLGLPRDRREEVLQRGARLDETAPGSGLGLSIIDELARAYGGALKLGDSGLGGLRLEVDLPRAEA
ncbi:MAG: sensor histidine kinase [Phenylobacterium sp.]|uniref:ATP-binding protein n=1 Tax=Phenylobacterium sp. TaxID=1871053 RepID=UPI00262F4F3F|nr:ATP-binding protein [Phenylobacterium sp.]MDB5434937.1 sensor histidine kinase [Phenylobacterium sp.]MDB5496390.1 sensor histidine kinase [Phenylobacterium sp.]